MQEGERYVTWQATGHGISGEISKQFIIVFLVMRLLLVSMGRTSPRRAHQRMEGGGEGAEEEGQSRLYFF